MTLEEQARELYARRDKLARELSAIDAELNKLRARYMAETNTYGIHPANFRRAIETVRYAA